MSMRPGGGQPQARRAHYDPRRRATRLPTLVRRRAPRERRAKPTQASLYTHIARHCGPCPQHSRPRLHREPRP